VRQKIIWLIRNRPAGRNHYTVSEIAKKFKISKERAAKTIFQLFKKKRLEIYGQLVLPKKRRPRD
jgi:hypothetical protein